MKLYHYMDSKYGLENLRDRKIKASTFDSLNDPFELAGINTSDKSIRSALKEMKKQVTSKFGILCFSEIWSNPVQWAHYAENHRGICIELQLSDKDDAQRVNYVNERLGENIISGDSAFSEKLLLTKFKYWQYEQEYRIIRQLKNFEHHNGLYFQPFNEHIKLKKIIIGCQSKITRQKLLEHLSTYDKSVEIIYSRPAFKSFKIVKHKSK